MATGIVIPHEQSTPIYESRFNGLRDYQLAVDGHIEALDLDIPASTIFANDESKILGLPLNRRATLLWWLSTPIFRHRDVICGNAVVIGQPDSEGETQSIPQDLRTLLLDRARYRVEVQTVSETERWSGNRMVFADFFEAANWGLSLWDRWTLVTGVRVVDA